MRNKKVCLVLIVIAIIAALLGCIISYANNNETVYNLNIKLSFYIFSFLLLKSIFLEWDSIAILKLIG